MKDGMYLKIYAEVTELAKAFDLTDRHHEFIAEAVVLCKKERSRAETVEEVERLEQVKFCTVNDAHAHSTRTQELEAEVEQLRDENYTELLDQMDRSWGNATEIGRTEINVFLESRIVHKPITRLRAENKRLTDILKEIKEGKGAYDSDPLKHCANTVEEMKRLAGQGLEKEQG